MRFSFDFLPSRNKKRFRHITPALLYLFPRHCLPVAVAGDCEHFKLISVEIKWVFLIFLSHLNRDFNVFVSEICNVHVDC